MNDSEKWTEQTWSVPAHSVVLRKKDQEWYFSNFMGDFKIPVEAHIGKQLAVKFEATFIEEDWIDRHSLQFRWLRFWYRRKKKREERHA